MKLKLTLLFLAVAFIAMAQKKEMRKIEKAIEKENFLEAFKVFKSIDENAVEEKYQGQYNFYKAAVSIDISSSQSVSLDRIRTTEQALKKAEDLNFDFDDTKSLVINSIQDKKFSLAGENIKNNDLDTAVMLLQEIYNIDTSNLNMLFNVANLRYDLAEYEKAQYNYQKLYDNNYVGGNVVYYAFDKSTKKNEVFQNIALRTAALKSGKYHTPSEETFDTHIGDIVNKLVWLLRRNDQLKEAKVLFDDALNKYPDDKSFILVKPDIYLNLGLMEEYKKSLGVGSDITDPNALNNLGDAAFKAKKFDMAIVYYLKSIKSDDQSTYPHINLANTFIEKGNIKTTTNEDKVELYKKAIIELELAHELDVINADVINGLIGLYGAFGNQNKIEEYKAKL
jgi:Tfp pilus assembly protein PilF